MILGRRLLDQSANLGGAGERNEVEIRVIGQRGTRFLAVARDDVDDPGRKAHLMRQLRQAEHRQARFLAGFSTVALPQARAGPRERPNIWAG